MDFYYLLPSVLLIGYGNILITCLIYVDCSCNGQSSVSWVKQANQMVGENFEVLSKHLLDFTEPFPG